MEPLPDYGNPPVVETVLGVQFERIPGLKNGHLGAFWNSLDRGQWPTVLDAPPLPQQLEQFDQDAGWIRGLQLQLSQEPASRLQIRNLENDRMIQLQNGRIHLNWLKRESEPYPRFERIRDDFIPILEQFKLFAEEQGLGAIRPNQWEVTYVNQIPQGTVWQTPEDWQFFLPLARVPSIPGIFKGESFGGEWHFTIPEKRGRLHVAWEHGKQKSNTLVSDGNATEFIRLTLTARGPVTNVGDGMQPILDGLSLGRETIVRSFKSLMSDDANHYWELKQ